MSKRRRRAQKSFENVPVVDAGARGKSVAKTEEGEVIFLTDAVPGDVVNIQTFKKKRSFYEGRVTKFIELSERRAAPVCKHFNTCGGCKWQHMTYESQLYFKQKEVVENLTRIGHLELPEITSIAGSSQQYHYRNKMEFSFSANRWLTLEEIQSDVEIEDKKALGFHIPGMWDKILHLDECHLHPQIGEDIRLSVHAFAKAENISYFNPREKSGTLRTLMLRMSSTGENMVVIQFFQDNEAQRVALLDHLKESFPQITSLQYIINEKANDTIYDQDVICYHGRDHIFEEMEGLQFKINAKSFYQTNSQQAYELYKITRDFAGLSGEELVYDLYTGTGTIAQFVAKKAKHVVGIEAIPVAIEDAKTNAQHNGIDNTTFFAGDMKEVFTQEFIDEHGQPDVVITDPPRDGMHKDVVAQLLQLSAKKIVYVSCNSATQARDLALLNEKYEITKVQPVDMFPQTHHVENVVLLELRK
ncbi:23S rRNA (uracil1939-C5)-methyltransferase [Nonlabens dokdonensis]|uniref:RNA methyltransferase n=2 Tax=Nonlabens dokdonensis TaxID=328515 RepID=L7W5W6_NONDD|nr:23S rRNA (uracil(1939)-C(5))-methyltransferase RlmD [Nonlabens dokdonensis]AGC75499.1 RNA methyltransferase [Nonlabens dokdonensis DSW-6]PZX43195.1 23S rRNA (uracil1939-C5)-methyltransferase [Nonlabens dokdonensis]